MVALKALLQTAVVLAPFGAVLYALHASVGVAVFWFLGIFIIMLITLATGPTARPRVKDPKKHTARDSTSASAHSAE